MIITMIAGSLLLLTLVVYTFSSLPAYHKNYISHILGLHLFQQINQHDVLETQLEIREQTMKNISQEIHDNIGQVLSLVNLHLSSIEINNNPHVSIKICKSMELVSKAVNDLRNLSKTMDGDNIGLVGLIESVQLDLELIERTGLISTSCVLSGFEYRMEPSKEIVIYRIIQEVLQNIIKHSRATSIIIQVHFLEERFVIIVTDNGIGFDMGFACVCDKKIGAGMRNIQNRAQLIGALLNIKTGSGQGTRVSLSLPVSLAVSVQSNKW